jgi:hypothetical protein
MTSQKPSALGKIIRILAIVLFAFTTFFNLMGGIGTSCVALNPTRWSPSMAKLAPYQWLYILLMITATAIAIWGILVTIALARGKGHAYRNALIVLALSALAAGVQTYASIALRGKGAPQNMRFYITLFTLIVFLILRLPPIWKRIGGFRRGGEADWQTPAGLAAFVGGLVALTTPIWADATHIGPDGAHWVNVLRLPLLLGGALLAFGGAALVWEVNHRGEKQIREETAPARQPGIGG